MPIALRLLTQPPLEDHGNKVVKGHEANIDKVLSNIFTVLNSEMDPLSRVVLKAI